MTSNRTLTRTLVTILIACLVAPAALALPDLGVWNAADQFESDNASVLPCNDQGIVWNGVGSPLVAASIQAAGSQTCDRMSLVAGITIVRDASVTGGVDNDGDLTIRVVFPVIETPFFVPLHEQDPDNATFITKAER